MQTSKFLKKYAGQVRWVLFFGQFLALLMIAVGNWPSWLVWIGLGLSLAYLCIFSLWDGLLFLVFSVPFYVALPLLNFDTLATWRILFLVLFIKWIWLEIIGRKVRPVFLPWDKPMGLFAIVAVLTTLLFARFRLEGLRQLVFLFNIWIFYVLVVNLIKTKMQVVEAVRAAAIALTAIIALGYAQLFVTFFLSLDVFWVYWASFVSKLYFGSYFASVSLYSNSWFSFAGGGRDLRMFSILPDSQSFAYLSALGLGFGTALTYAVGRRLKRWLWSGIRFAGLAVMLSGTRAVWVGMLAPFFAICLALYKNFLKPAAKKFFWAFLMVLILFMISPLFNKGLQYLRVGGKFQENFVDRARSIYDLNETSNAGRIAIWKESLAYAVLHPWGTGVKNFIVSQNTDSALPQSYDDLAQRHNQRYNLPQVYVSAHSLYLQILVETGLVGLVVFAYFWFMVLREFWKFLFLRRDDNDFWVFFVFQSALIFLWILAAGVFDVTLFNDRVLMFFFLTLGLSGAIIKHYEEWNQSHA